MPRFFRLFLGGAAGSCAAECASGECASIDSVVVQHAPRCDFAAQAASTRARRAPSRPRRRRPLRASRPEPPPSRDVSLCIVPSSYLFKLFPVVRVGLCADHERSGQQVCEHVPHALRHKLTHVLAGHCGLCLDRVAAAGWTGVNENLTTIEPQSGLVASHSKCKASHESPHSRLTRLGRALTRDPPFWPSQATVKRGLCEMPRGLVAVTSRQH